MAPPAPRSPAMVCNNGWHWIGRDVVLAASHQPQKSRAPGVDHVTAQQYTERLDEHLRELHERRRDGRYEAPPVERGGSEQEGGKQRPRGNPGVEAKSVQRAVGMRLEAIVAQDFHTFSHGFRKGHSPQHALHALRAPCRTLPINGIVEADVRGWFDHLAWSPLRAFSQPRGKEGSILRLLGQWLHAGVGEAGALMHPDKGTPQGGGLAPLLAHVFVHHVLDEGVVKDGQPRMQGRCLRTRFADDFIIGCALEADARRVMEVLPKRFARFRLPMHPEKTVLLAVKRPPSRNQSAGGTGTFAFLGFTHYWGKTRQGDWVIKRKTLGKRLRRCMHERWTWCRDHRHAPLHAPHRTLRAKRRGDDPYDGRRGNCTMLEVVCAHVERAWHDWLSTRRHTGHIHWQQVEGFLRQQLPRPKPRILHHIEQGQQSDAPHGVSPVWCATGASGWLPRNRMR